jgi:hypothetical protein
MKRRTKAQLRKEFKFLRDKTDEQLDKELMDFIMHKKKNPEEVRAIMRACFEKRIYEKTRKLH